MGAREQVHGESVSSRRLISVSSASTLLMCPRRYKWRVVDGWEPRRTRPAIAFGSAVHAGLDAFYRAKVGDLLTPIQTPEQAVDAWVAGRVAALDTIRANAGTFSAAALDETSREEYEIEVAEIAAMAKRVLVRYVAKYAVEDSERWEVVSVEQAYRLPLLTAQGHVSTKWDLVIRPDLVLRDRATGHHWIVDHKTTSTSDPEQVRKQLYGSPQLRVYLGALTRLLGVYFHGVRFNVIRSREPGVPSANKDGSMSRVACDTLAENYKARWETCQADLEARGGKLMAWADYAEHYDKLVRRGDSFLYRMEQFVAPWDQELALQEMWRAARMVEPMARIGYPRNLGACNIPGRECPYKSACLDAHCTQEQIDSQFVRASGGTLGAPEIPPAAFAGAAGMGEQGAIPQASFDEEEEA